MSKPVAKEDMKLKDYSRPENYELDLVQRERLTIARVQLLMNHPFFGTLATRLIIEEASDWCPNAATNGRHFYYNQYFIADLDDKELQFLVAHEVMHCVYDHMSVDVREDRDPQLFNIAADYNINMTIEDNKIGRVITAVPILLDRKYSGKTSFEIYDDLYENAEKIDIQQLVDKLLDEHLEDKEEAGGGDEEGDNDEKKKGPAKLSEAEKKSIKDEIKSAVLQAAQAAGAGNVPGDVQRMIKELTSPKMGWRELLRVNLESSLKNDYTWMRPSRKGWHTGAILPGMNNSERLEVAIALDLSGSISDTMVRDFLSEVKGIMEQYDDYNINIWCFDTDAYSLETYTSDDGKDIRDYPIRGGGGTLFEVNWDFMKAQGIEPNQFIMFTDGGCWNSWGDENYCDTLFVIHSNPTTNAPFGVTAHYEFDHLKKAA